MEGTFQQEKQATQSQIKPLQTRNLINLQLKTQWRGAVVGQVQAQGKIVSGSAAETQD